MELNKAMMIGNLTRDPETRHTTSGMQVTSFTIAVNTRRGQGKDETLYIKIETWQKTAELCAQYLQKGAMVLVEGRLKLEEYESRDGQKRRDPVIVADRVQFGPKSSGRDGGAPSGGRASDGDSYDSPPPARREAPPASSYRRDQPARREAPPAADYPESSGDGGGTNDDLPF